MGAKTERRYTPAPISSILVSITNFPNNALPANRAYRRHAVGTFDGVNILARIARPAHTGAINVAKQPSVTLPTPLLCDPFNVGRVPLISMYEVIGASTLAAAFAAQPHRHARGHFEAIGHPIIKGYDPPEGWGWCNIHDIEVDLPSQTPHNGPIPRFI